MNDCFSFIRTVHNELSVIESENNLDLIYVCDILCLSLGN